MNGRGGHRDAAERPPHHTGIREWIIAGATGLVLALAAGLLLRAFVIGAVRVPSRSMAATVQPGDHVLVSKLVAHRSFSLPLPFCDEPLRLHLPLLRPIRRGDVVVAVPPSPGIPAEPRGTIFVLKRCAGVPGDTLVFSGEHLTVNGRRLILPATAMQSRIPAWLPVAGRPDTVIVPPGAYFLLGDNPRESVDSRTWGPVPAASITGIATIVYWSTVRTPDGGLSVRWDRIGTVIR